MPAKSSNNLATELNAGKAALASTEIRWNGRLLLLLLNCVPAVHFLSILAVLLVPLIDWPQRICVAFALLYLAPPFGARLVLRLMPISESPIAIGSKAFFGWWTSFQLQVVFCRLQFLEELLRLIPGLYSLWLRLWGSRIGRLTYWSAGTTITDRSFLCIGDDVVFGAGVRLNAHVLAKGKDGKMELLLAPLKIGDRVLIGGYSLLTSGVEIASDQSTRAELLLPPFSIWKDGKRFKEEQPDEIK